LNAAAFRTSKCFLTTLGFGVPLERSPRVYLLFPPMGYLSSEGSAVETNGRPTRLFWNTCSQKTVILHALTLLTFKKQKKANSNSWVRQTSNSNFADFAKIENA
jgi:hypothetical protein